RAPAERDVGAAGGGRRGRATAGGARRAQDADAHGGGRALPPRTLFREQRRGQSRRSPPERMASSTCSGCCSALATFFQCRFTFPSGPIHTVERMTPMVFLPYIIFSPYAPYVFIILRSGSESSGNGSLYFLMNF